MKILAFAAFGTLFTMGLDSGAQGLIMDLVILFCIIGWPVAFIYSKVKRFKNTNKQQANAHKAAILQKR